MLDVHSWILNFHGAQESFFKIQDLLFMISLFELDWIHVPGVVWVLIHDLDYKFQELILVCVELHDIHDKPFTLQVDCCSHVNPKCLWFNEPSMLPMCLITCLWEWNNDIIAC